MSCLSVHLHRIVASQRDEASRAVELNLAYRVWPTDNKVATESVSLIDFIAPRREKVEVDLC